MKSNAARIAAVILGITLMGAFAPSAGAANLSQSVEIGYIWDLGGTFRLRIGDLSEELPFFIDAGFTFAYQFDSGDATKARVIFINDNTGGIIEKHGENYGAALDVGYPLSQEGKFIFEPYFGARYNHYKAFYAFIGNNEAFTVRTNQWGLALGARLKLPVSRRGDMFYVNGGAEYYFKADLLSHGTYYYTPDDSDDRPRTDGGGHTYDYEEADEVVRQPQFRPVVVLGLQFSIR